jgi:hypothetical protein
MDAPRRRPPVSFSVDEVIGALFVGILGREPDREGRATYMGILEQSPAALSSVVDSLFNSEERRGTSFSPAEVMNALYTAALGRSPDEAGQATYLGWIADPSPKALQRIAVALFNSPEHQNRLLPVNLAEQVLIDHSPSGEFVALLQHLVARSYGRGLMVEVGLAVPSASYSIDFLRLSGWRGILIEHSPDLRAAIESRFSGLDFRLVQARVLNTELEEESAESLALRSAPIDMAKLSKKNTALVRLASVLAEVGAPTNFEILAVSGAYNTADVINDLLETSDYRPAFIIVGLQAPQIWTTFTNVGLSPRVEQLYEVASATSLSIILARR